jgi:ABC-type lipoprotein release transport system permease subunit
MEGFGSHLPVELDPVRLLATMAALLTVSVTAAAVPALKAGHRK